MAVMITMVVIPFLELIIFQIAYEYVHYLK